VSDFSESNQEKDIFEKHLDFNKDEGKDFVKKKRKSYIHCD
jgi:hypothetical protein